MTDRLTQLADRFGADPELHAGRPLIVEATKEYHSRTKPGDRSYGRFGEDIITVGEIVSQVYVRWAADERVTPDFFDSLVGQDAEAKMLRRYCISAADDVLQANIQWRRIEGMSVANLDDVSPKTDDGEADLEWLLNSVRYASGAAEDEALHDYRSDLIEEVWEGIAHDIIDGVAHEGMREALRLYVFEGLQHKEIAERLNLSIETSKKAYARGVKDEEAIACLVVVRNLRFKGEAGTGRAPKAPKVMPVKLIEAARELGVDSDSALKQEREEITPEPTPKPLGSFTKITGQEWRRQNPIEAVEQERNTAAARRRRESGASGSHTESEWQAFRSRVGGCGIALALPDRAHECEGPIEKGHLLPLARSKASDALEDLLPMCSEHNGTRGQWWQYLEEWLGEEDAAKVWEYRRSAG